MSRKEKRKQLVAEADALIALYHLKIVHVRKVDDDGDTHSKGGATVVYHKHNKKDRIIVLSVALVNDVDCYCKLQGRLVAAYKFHQSDRITLRVPKNMPVAQFVKRTFYWMVQG